MSRSREIGTRAESAVVRYLQANGFPHAERRALRGADDAGDITGTPGICWSVKGGHAARTASDGTINKWLFDLETQRLNAGADVGVLVVQRKGIGAPNAGRWWAIMNIAHFGDLCGMAVDRFWSFPVRLHLADAVVLLRTAGYGNPGEADHGT